MNNIVEKQIQLHLTEYAELTPIDVLEYQDYVEALRHVYAQRFIVTWLHLSIGLWLIINVVFGVAGLWFAWFPLVSIAFIGVVFRIITAE